MIVKIFSEIDKYFKLVTKALKSERKYRIMIQDLIEREECAMRKLIAALVMLVMLACMFIPSVSFTEDKDTVLLARTIYALGKGESYETKLALGSVVMNRVESSWFRDSLGEVLAEQQQFPTGSRYDDDSLRAAHDVISGTRALPADALYYQAADSANAWGSDYQVDSIGNYNFYSRSGNK